MPHKRAKRSARDQQRNISGSDHAPVSNSLSQEPIPKSVARVLNAAKVREEFREKKRHIDMDEHVGRISDGPTKKKRKTTDGESMKIQQGESLAHFNKRVENSLRGTVRDAMQSSAAHVRKEKKEATNSKGMFAGSVDKAQTASLRLLKAQSAPPADMKRGVSERLRRTEFTQLSSSAPRRLNDVVQAPPELKHLPRGAKPKVFTKESASSKPGSLQEGMLSMARKAMLEEERERVVQMYREMKKRNTVA